MRIATAEPATASRTMSSVFIRSGILRRADPRQRRNVRLECLALAMVTLVIVTGVWIDYRRQASTFAAATRELAAGTIVQPGVAPVSALANRLTVFSSPAERAYVATAVDGAARADGGLTHVGALAAITVPAHDVAANPRLSVLRERLERRPDVSAVRLFAPGEIAAVKPSLIVRTPAQYSRQVWGALALFLAAVWFTHLARRLFGTTSDPVLVPAMALLSGLSLIAMLSLRDPLRDTMAIASVAAGVALACMALVAVSAVDFEHPRVRFSVGVPLATGIVLALLLLVFGSGPTGSGVTVNLWGAQPIEAIRVCAVFALAAYFGRRWETVRELSERPAVTPYLRLPRWRDVSPLVVIVGSLLVFFFLQRDLGPALVLGCMSLGLYGVARGRSALVLTGLAVLVAGFVAGYELGIPATVSRRVAIWLAPWDNGLPGGDQIAHGLWSLASGGIAGLGLGVGDGQLVPAGHTDLIVAVLGEEVGLIGVMAIAAVYLLLVWRMLAIAARAPGDYTAFLALGCALSLAIPAIVIVGGVLGAIPLSGVVTPFLSFGKSSMISNFVAVGIVLAIARRAGPARPQFLRQVRTVGVVLGTAGLFLVADAARIQAWQADTLAVRPTLVQQGDGVARYQYNPRLVRAAHLLPRGTIFDRNGLALATDDPGRGAAAVQRLRAVGLPAECPPAPARCYPLGGRTFHLLGDGERQTNWTAPNASFVERDFNATLQGFDDHPRTVERTLPDGRRQLVVTRDYADLLPLVRHKGDPEAAAVRRLTMRQRDVTTSVDARFQMLVARALEARMRAAGAERGAVVVIDPDTGELLALANAPYPEIQVATDAHPPRPSPAALLDRGRFGLYPPGSTFKLITAAAALRAGARSGSFMCQRLEDGRVGARVPGFRGAVRDDVLDHEPHGRVDLHKGLVVSCNAYFAQLAVAVGAKAVADAARATGVSVANPPEDEHLRRTLAYAGYGQGEVLASPLRMARIAGAIASDGVLRDVTVLRRERDGASLPPGTRWLTSEQASFLATSMRDVVKEGTGRALASHRVAIAGKTGTAEVAGAPSHAWFVGFAPYATRGRRIAFAVIVENAGYGGRIAAPLAGDVVSAAQAAGVIR